MNQTDSEKPARIAFLDYMQGDDQCEEIVREFKMLSSRTRCRVLLLLQRSDLNAGGLARACKASLTALSHHLTLLRAAKFVECKHHGKHRIYSLTSHMRAPLNKFKILMGVLANDGILTQGNGADPTLE